MKQKKRNILYTCALTYANGPLHLGHMVEYIQADIWGRFQRLCGHNALFVGGEDTHGTPIMVKAEQQGITPEALIDKMGKAHRADLDGFFIDLDFFYTTHSPESRQFTETIYRRLCDNKDIEKRVIKQLYDPAKEMFLPDRFVKGQCPRCGAKEQYGDICEVCGASYQPTDLINPLSAVSNEKPILRESEHYFFRLDKYDTLLKDWARGGHLQPEVVNKLEEWFGVGLKQWDISRDAPYFGFEIPDAPGKYFYVWLDAPIGYMASFQKLCEQRPELSFDDYWTDGHDTELYHFVGKDIIYFHALFWPAMLIGSGYRSPTAIFTHGFVTINGHKMSKSRGTFIKARDYLEHLNPEYLRYYFANKLNDHVDDIDFNFDDFIQRINSDLVGKVVNIASRCAGFILKGFDGKLAAKLPNAKLFDEFVEAGKQIADFYDARQFHRAVREIMALADRANQYIDEQKPWVMAKEAGQEKRVHDACSLGLNLFRVLMIYLKPILPKMAEDAEAFLNSPINNWEDRRSPLLDHTINKFKPLMQRVAPEDVEHLT